MPAPALLITQCLQNDFVKPLRRFEPLPNRLHIGFDAARRLIGERASESAHPPAGGGPVDLIMRWACDQSPEALEIIHIRDWHDGRDPNQQEHFLQFGEHCVQHTEGAEFVFDSALLERPCAIVDSLGLNDFIGTQLDQLLAPHAGQVTRVGVIGVWTEAKITFLIYDLRTRYPSLEIGVCSALVAGSSRSHHLVALEQLQRILGVRVFSSMGDFSQWLGGSDALELALPSRLGDYPQLLGEEAAQLDAQDRELLRHLFRDCRSLELRSLAGGFSGNRVLATISIDLHGHQQVPHVVKIGPQQAIGRERAAFEQIEEVLGNSAPSIGDFADLGGRGALKYRYAAMGGGASTTFQALYQKGLDQAGVDRLLGTVFEDQLGRLYRAAEAEEINLLDYYWFSPDRAPNLASAIRQLLGSPAEGEQLTLPGDLRCSNPIPFYTRDLPRLRERARGTSRTAWLHGDLNGANIIVDSQQNVWLIDFFHAHRGHVLKDLIKLENDLLYIMTPLESEVDLVAACALTDRLLAVDDLRYPVPAASPMEGKLAAAPTDLPVSLRRAQASIRRLRGFIPALVQTDRDPLQLFIGLLRYAAHTLSFDEPGRLQKLWALYACGRLCDAIRERLERRGPLRVDWLTQPGISIRGGALGITLLPGRLDQGRNLADDLAMLQQDQVDWLVSLVNDEELEHYGVADLPDACRARGLGLRRLPILDQSVPSEDEMNQLLDWIDQRLASGQRLVLHCVGGLGRSGLVAACWLVRHGHAPEQAMTEVRRARSPRAIESAQQEAFVAQFSAAKQIKKPLPT